MYGQPRVVQRRDGPDVLALEAKLGDAIVFQDGYPVSGRHLDDLAPALDGHGPGLRVLERRNQVDELGPLALSDGGHNRLLEGVGRHASTIADDAPYVRVEAPQRPECATVDEVVDDDDVPWVDQRFRHEVDGLARPLRQQDVVR